MTTHLAPAPAAPAAAAERSCARCGISARYPGLSFDASGVCSLCAMYAQHGPEIHSYFGEVDEFVRLVRARARERGSDHDCLLLYSGGKDSSYVLYRLMDLGLRVRTFTFDNGFISKTALRNVETITSELGIEHVTATRADQNRVFLRSLQQHKSVCNGCFRSLLDLSTQHAHDLGIPTIVTGLSRGQIMDERLSWFHRQGIFDPAEIEPRLTAGRRVYHQSGQDGTLTSEAVDSVEVVDYYRYSDVTKDGIRALLRERSDLWSQPGDTGFCSSNCMINDTGVLVHSRERGFHNYEAPTRWEVRLGHLARGEADEELRPPAETPRIREQLLQIGYRLPPEGTVPAAAAAPAAERTTPAPAATAPLTAALTPAQQEVLDRDPHEPGRRARALLLQTTDGVDAARVRKAALQLSLHHQALRLRFERRPDGWRQYDAGVAGALPVLRLDLSAREASEEPGLLRTAVDRMRANLSLTDGPLARIALVERGQRPARLLLVVHELLADTRSWRLLLRDLCTLWAAPGQSTALEPAEPFLERAAATTAAPAAPAAHEPPACGEEPRRLRVTCAATASADEVADALARVLEDLGDEPAVEVLDHTAADGPTGVGRWSRARAAESGAAPLIRYEHMGDLAALLPADAPLSLVDTDAVDFTDLPGTGRDLLTVVGVVRGAVLYLDWWCPPARWGRLLAAGVPERVARRLAAAVTP